jgi:hypothetical protein
MSQYQAPVAAAPAAPYPQYVMVPMKEGNGLGVAGFFIASIGLFIPTGIIALLGMLVSLVALGKAPRGFASMGELVGLVGSVVWMVITGVVLLGVIAVGGAMAIGGAAAFILTNPEVIEVSADMFNVTIAAVEYEEENGSLPDDLEALELSASTRTDPWGNPYLYKITTSEPGFDIMSSGRDGVMGTDDDLALSRIDEMWENAGENFGAQLKDFGERMERLDHMQIKHSSSNSPWGSSVRTGGCNTTADILRELRASLAEAAATDPVR